MRSFALRHPPLSCPINGLMLYRAVGEFDSSGPIKYARANGSVCRHGRQIKKWLFPQSGMRIAFQALDLAR
jgi:hypothetical protein